MISRLILALSLLASLVVGAAAAEEGAVRSVTIRTQRDMGFFAGDMVRADIDLVVDPAFSLDEASLPRPGPVNYWLDLRSIAPVARQETSERRRYTLHIVYQNFYNALDARQQEIPALALRLTKAGESVAATVPAWTIGVSPLREVAPPSKEDPKDYLRADMAVPAARSAPYFWGAVAFAAAALLSLVPLAADRAWFPFHKRPARVFAAAVRRLRRLDTRGDAPGAYLEALLVLHRGIDQTDGQRVLADDVPAFLERHRAFLPARDGFLQFFAASRRAFFGSDPAKAKADLGFKALESFARQLSAIERSAT